MFLDNSNKCNVKFLIVSHGVPFTSCSMAQGISTLNHNCDTRRTRHAPCAVCHLVWTAPLRQRRSFYVDACVMLQVSCVMCLCHPVWKPPYTPRHQNKATRSRQNRTTLQHEQRSSGELNVLRGFSLQPAVTFSLLIGSMRCFDHCILKFFLNLTIPLLFICRGILFL
jgi:hypothetical protein